MPNKIIIEENEGKVSLSLSAVPWPTALLMLSSTIKQLATITIDQVTKDYDIPRDEVAGDVADQINYAISNVLTTIAPPDPDLQLSEVAIATMENEIIHYAADKHIPIEQALKEYEESLLSNSKYAAEPSKSLKLKKSKKEAT